MEFSLERANEWLYMQEGEMMACGHIEGRAFSKRPYSWPPRDNIDNEYMQLCSINIICCIYRNLYGGYLEQFLRL